MNKFTYRELEKIRDLIKEPWDENTTHIIIPCVNDEVFLIKIGDKFTIKLEKYILNEPPNFTLSKDWNNDTVPPEQVLDAEVVKIYGNMTGIKALGKESKVYWEGWLPNKGFEIL